MGSIVHIGGRMSTGADENCRKKARFDSGPNYVNYLPEMILASWSFRSISMPLVKVGDRLVSPAMSALYSWPLCIAT